MDCMPINYNIYNVLNCPTVDNGAFVLLVDRNYGSMAVTGLVVDGVVYMDNGTFMDTTNKAERRVQVYVFDHSKCTESELKRWRRCVNYAQRNVFTPKALRGDCQLMPVNFTPGQAWVTQYGVVFVYFGIRRIVTVKTDGTLDARVKHAYLRCAVAVPEQVLLNARRSKTVVDSVDYANMLANAGLTVGNVAGNDEVFNVTLMSSSKIFFIDGKPVRDLGVLPVPTGTITVHEDDRTVDLFA